MSQKRLLSLLCTNIISCCCGGRGVFPFQPRAGGDSLVTLLPNPPPTVTNLPVLTWLEPPAKTIAIILQWVSPTQIASDHRLLVSQSINPHNNFCLGGTANNPVTIPVALVSHSSTEPLPWQQLIEIKVEPLTSPSPLLHSFPSTYTETAPCITLYNFSQLLVLCNISSNHSKHQQCFLYWLCRRSLISKTAFTWRPLLSVAERKG